MAISNQIIATYDTVHELPELTIPNAILRFSKDGTWAQFDRTDQSIASLHHPTRQ